MRQLLRSLLLFVVYSSHVDSFVVSPSSRRHGLSPSFALFGATELPDSLQDAAVRAAEATVAFSESTGPLGRCRIDFDTSIGDETFTLLKTSTEFMQNYVSALCYALIDGAQQQRQDEMMRVATARAELKALEDSEQINEEKEEELLKIIEQNGRDDAMVWKGPVARIYFPDEGNAALARRDWKEHVPPCVVFSSCGGVQMQDVSKDELCLFFCPKASESESVEQILQRTETTATNLRMTIFVNPNLVDMGVTGFGLAGRMLRERLIDPLQHVYYLRTLQWGALTRQWPLEYSVWQEDENAQGGYRLIKTLDRLPSNPEVEDIYDIENGNMQEKKSGGLLDQLGDFVNGMMRL